MSATQTLQQYAATHSAAGSTKPLSERTVKRWLAEGELPGAHQDERGRWQIPADAVRTPRMAGQVVSMTARQSDNIVSAVGSPTPEQLNYNVLPTFLSLEQAAFLLDLPLGTLQNKTNRRYFRVRKLGGKLRMPLSRVKKLRGIRS